MAYPIFDRSHLQLRPLAERKHDFTRSEMLSPGDPLPALSRTRPWNLEIWRPA